MIPSRWNTAFSCLEIRTCDLTHIRLTDEKQIDRSKISKLIQTLNELISGTKQETDRNDLPPIHFQPAQTLTMPNISHQEILTDAEFVIHIHFWK